MNRTAFAATALAVVAVITVGGVFGVVAGRSTPSQDSSAVIALRPPTTAAPAPTEVELPRELVAVTGAWPTDWTRRTIDLGELKIGLNASDPRDLIRPLDQPTYESIESADQWLIDREIGVSLELSGVARFYPLRILTSHEIVNDELDGVPFAVTYCPLCNTAVAFDRRVDGEVLRFGVSGLLRNSDLVMWDDQTVSLWQQITGEGIVGSLAGVQLEAFPTATVRWGDFKISHPDGESLSQDTGFSFNYGSNSYVGYSDRAAPIGRFFDAPLDDRFPALDRVVGVRVADDTKAYPFSVIDEKRAINDELGGVPIAVWWVDTDSADNFDGARVGGGESIGTGIAFLREIEDQLLTFAPLGADTFVDSETGSTWSLFGEALDGPLAGTQLELALHQNEFWFAWSTFNPSSPVY